MKLSALRILDLNANHKTAIPSFSTLPKLEVLSLCDNPSGSKILKVGGGCGIMTFLLRPCSKNSTRALSIRGAFQPDQLYRRKDFAEVALLQHRQKLLRIEMRPADLGVMVENLPS